MTEWKFFVLALLLFFSLGYVSYDFGYKAGYRRGLCEGKSFFDRLMETVERLLSDKENE